MKNKNFYDPWPPFSYDEFKATGYLLHHITQIMGKLKLLTPFEPHWSNVALWISTRGLTTGPIPYAGQTFEIELDLNLHQLNFLTSWNRSAALILHSGSVAEIYATMMNILHDLEINVSINLKPQEVPDPISFDQDEQERPYERLLINTWWRVLLSSYHVLQKYHARFCGITPPIGLMWGTFDLRDARYTTKKIDVKDKGFITRNAMDVEQIEAGWWAGNANYPKAAYFAFTYPQPAGIEQGNIKPEAAHWDANLKEFILDYEDLRKTKNPDESLLNFFESTYQVGAKQVGWNDDLIGPECPRSVE